MTLAALALDRSDFVLCSDVLTSAPNVPNSILPTTIFRDTSKVVNYGNTLFRPRSLQQKTYIFSKYVVMVGAGSLFEISLLKKFLQKKLPTDPVSRDAFDRLLASYSGPTNASEYAFALIDHDNTIYARGLNTCSFQYSGIEHLFSLGSGTSDLLSSLDLNDGNYFYSNQAKPDCILEILGFFASSVIRQHYTGFGQSNLWGAGFEIVLRNQSGFYKPESNFTRIWTADKKGDDFTFVLSDFVLYQEYTKGGLYIFPITPNMLTQHVFVAPEIGKHGFAVEQTKHKYPSLFIDICVYEAECRCDRVYTCRFADANEPPKLILQNEGLKFVKKPGERERLFAQFRRLLNS